MAPRTASRDSLCSAHRSHRLTSFLAIAAGPAFLVGLLALAPVLAPRAAAASWLSSIGDLREEEVGNPRKEDEAEEGDKDEDEEKEDEDEEKEEEEEEEKEHRRSRDPKRSVQLKRQGAGLRVGTWQVEDLEEVPGGDYDESLALEGYFQRGLDLHLSIESTLGFWRRSQDVVETSGLGSTREQVHSYLIPAFTAIKFFPATRPGDPLEPYIGAGIGFSLGIDNEEIETTVVGGGTTTSSDTDLLGGFGFKVGPGLDWWFSQIFGLTAGARYQWIRFGQEVGGEDTYKGYAFDAGMTYRFQYE